MRHAHKVNKKWFSARDLLAGFIIAEAVLIPPVETGGYIYAKEH